MICRLFAAVTDVDLPDPAALPGLAGAEGLPRPNDPHPDDPQLRAWPPIIHQHGRFFNVRVNYARVPAAGEQGSAP
jgi:hypothetical protein